MRTILALRAVSVALAVTGASALAGTGDSASARVYASDSAPLTAPSKTAPATIVGKFLRERGVSAPTVATMNLVSSVRSARTRLTYVRFEQQVAGVRVADAYAKAALTERGELVNVIESLAPADARSARGARIDERGALGKALEHLRFGLQDVPVESGRSGNVARFDRGNFFRQDPSVERVAISNGDGSFGVGYLVETWTEKGNLLHETLVNGDGAVASVELRTSSDSYNVFTEDPGKTPQAVVPGRPGWLFPGAQRSIDIAGNNVHAYLDAKSNNKPDAGGTTVSDGNFLTAANLGVTPTTAANQNVAVQNLFFLNNVIHDDLLSHGFDEAAGNFQETNTTGAGGDGDSVEAEAQDGGGIDNANFATPRDGGNPRMQMYLWLGHGTHTVTVNAPAGIAGDYLAEGAGFGPALSTTGVAGAVTLVDDGTDPKTDACQSLSGLSGQIALVDRGTCDFTVKVKNAQNAGAVGVIVANNQATLPFTMGGTDRSISIPSVMVSRETGATLRSVAGVTATIKKSDPQPLMVDGDLDSDVVWHEYGHGLTWRMIGKMSGPLAAAIGEGMSDVLAVIENGDDRVGEYAAGDPLGIRTEPYANYSRTYGDIVGSEVHLDGEVYGAIGWRLYQNFLGAGLSKSTLLDYLVDGMNFTPAQPTFEQMRDGVLQATPSDRDCLVWEAFAHYGVGVGAAAIVKGQNVAVTESMTLPQECS